MLPEDELSLSFLLFPRFDNLLAFFLKRLLMLASLSMPVLPKICDRAVRESSGKTRECLVVLVCTGFILTTLILWKGLMGRLLSRSRVLFQTR